MNEVNKTESMLRTLWLVLHPQQTSRSWGLLVDPWSHWMDFYMLHVSQRGGQAACYNPSCLLVLLLTLFFWTVRLHDTEIIMLNMTRWRFIIIFSHYFCKLTCIVCVICACCCFVSYVMCFITKKELFINSSANILFGWLVLLCCVIVSHDKLHLFVFIVDLHQFT